MTTSPIVECVSLATYAAVNAAITEGFGLPDVLAIEGLSAPMWKEAAAGVKAKLAREPTALASYAAELAAAEDWLSRRVTPLEDDPGAWVAFLHTFAKSTEPFALLETNRLGMNDISRLGRRWARWVEQDPAREKKLAELARAPGTLPPIEVEPPTLRRSRAAEAAHLLASIEEPPRSSVAGRRALNAHREVLRALAAKQAQAEPEMRPWSIVAAGALADPVLTALTPAMRGFLDVHDTQPSPEAPTSTPVVPFNPHASPQLPAPHGVRRFASLTGTEPAVEAPKRPALPFAAAAGPKTPGLAATLPVTEVVDAPESQPEPPTLPRPTRPELPLSMRRFADVQGTQTAEDTSRAAPGGSAEPALSFAPARANMPRPSSNIDAAFSFTAPRLPLDQYAQMSVELARYPTHRLGIYQRYGIDDEQRSRLDGYWSARVRENASIKLAWDRYYAEHWARLRDSQGGKR